MIVAKRSLVSNLSRRKRLAYRSLVVLMGLVAGLAIAEATVRVCNLKPQSLRGKTYLQPLTDARALYICYSSNPHGEFRPVPDVGQGDWRLSSCSLPPTPLPLSELKKTPWCVEDRSSDQGLRDRHYDVQPPAEKVRLAIVGDSFVRGEGVPVEGCLPKQLEALLGTNRFEVINAGRAGLGTAEEVGVVQKVAEKLNAQRVLLVFIPNDIHLPPALEQRQELINDLINIRDEHLARHNEKLWCYRYSRLLEYVGSFFQMRQIGQETVKWYLDSYDPAFNDEGLKLLAENFRSLAAQPNCKVALVIYPLMVGLENGYPLAPIHARVRQMAQDAGLPVLDLADAFKGMDTSSLQVHPCDHHPNSRAHAIAAKAIQNWLSTDLANFTKPTTP